jgi:DNA-binding NarL/FixJ family response regulator
MCRLHRFRDEPDKLANRRSDQGPAVSSGKQGFEAKRAPEEPVGRIALVVDDDPFFRIALGTILTGRLGCVQIIEAASFDEALERLSEHPSVSVGLFDLAMPGMGSPANLRVIRETFPQTLVVMVSASSARSDVISALQAGAHGYVPKSLGVAGIVAALQTIFEGTIYVPASLSDVLMAGPASDGQSPGKSAPPPPTALDALTPRQRDVLIRLMEGMSNKQIARDLKLGEGTVKIHMAALFRNLCVKSRAAAAAVGARMSRAATTA